MQFHTKFPDVSIAVGEERLVAIPQMLHDNPNLQVIILDDAFQHRSVRAGLNILMSVFILYPGTGLMVKMFSKDIVFAKVFLMG